MLFLTVVLSQCFLLGESELRIPIEHNSGPRPAADLEAGVPAAWLVCPHLFLALRVNEHSPKAERASDHRSKKGVMNCSETKTVKEEIIR